MRRTEFLELLPRMKKPGQYYPQEWNVPVMPEKEDLSIVFLFPDLYEVGMSNLSFRILQGLALTLPAIRAERAFIPDLDMIEAMEKHGIPLFSFETGTPVKEFELVGITLQYEMLYTNILLGLSIAGIPLKSEEREGFPLIVAGGPGASNPLPLEPFIDVFVVGDGESALVELIEIVRSLKYEGRATILEALSRLQGFFVPSFYRKGKKIQRRIEKDLDSLYFPTSPPVPSIEIVHERSVLEISRGCRHSCRFCQAGAIYKPYRERSFETLVKQGRELILNTGYESIALTSLSTTDHSSIEKLVEHFIGTFGPEKVAVSLSSLRIDDFSVRLASRVGEVKKTGLTFAPEAGSERMRRIINKHVSEEDLMRTVVSAFSCGWELIKLYFMIGLPGEQEEDVREIARMVNDVLATGKKYTPRARVNVSVNPFIPKPHTAFERFGAAGLEELEEKKKILLSLVRRGVSMKIHDIRPSLVEAALARGGREVAAVLEKVVELGENFSCWSERFNYERWLKAFGANGLELERYASRVFGRNETLPWSFVDTGHAPDYFILEAEAALKETYTPECGEEDSCNRCGICR